MIERDSDLFPPKSKKNKPRCYPQQRLGNNAGKENLRATLPNISKPETLPEPESEPSKLTGYCPKHSP